MKPREPNTRELFELMMLEVGKFAVAGKYAIEEEELVEGWIQQSAIAVFDGYITDGPGYKGKLMVVVWCGGPEFTSTYIWENGKIDQVHIDQYEMGTQERRNK